MTALKSFLVTVLHVAEFLVESVKLHLANRASELHVVTKEFGMIILHMNAECLVSFEYSTFDWTFECCDVKYQLMKSTSFLIQKLS